MMISTNIETTNLFLWNLQIHIDTQQQLQMIEQLEDDDFEGLYSYLEPTCNGEELLECGAKIDTGTDDDEAYLYLVDTCLNSNLCLSFHQVLEFYEKRVPYSL